MDTIVKEKTNMTKKTVYYVVFNAPDGCFKQIGTECDTKDEAQSICDRWNNGKDTNTGVYEVRSTTVNMDR